MGYFTSGERRGTILLVILMAVIIGIMAWIAASMRQPAAVAPLQSDGIEIDSIVSTSNKKKAIRKKRKKAIKKKSSRQKQSRDYLSEPIPTK